MHPDIKQADISYIFNHPWNITVKEWQLEDSFRKEAMVSYITNQLELTRTAGYAHIWKTIDNEPVAILGGYKIEDKKYETFFIASIHMEQHALKLSFDMRKILKEQAPHYKGCSCGLYSESEHPNQISWFRFLGFKYVPEGNRGNTRYFEYVSPS